ncbi:SoxR reducing system RseC family protein [Treponema sp. OMZ 857]|uniref:SoxR reducing system RseC family protein n=1 Tax=Treponema sp. OMZ 857 TaxID=1643513 RepID=UPI0020A49BED|nr:SoxR reducing system RseC family protein [Treponema sp. OMZ 857]UTC43991.1 hypothetical protein E4N66_07855 [Treponema sp. OMZ 857]
MEKTGRVIRIPITKRNGMQIATIEYDTPEADLCSIKSTDSRSGCASCGGGCHGCGGGGKDGLLVVQGNVVDALNVSGKDLWIGNKVGVFISEKAARFQGLCAVGIPLILSAGAFTAIFLRTQNEGLALAGIAAGLAVGAAIAFGINRILKERALPQIVTVYE